MKSRTLPCKRSCDAAVPAYHRLQLAKTPSLSVQAAEHTRPPQARMRSLKRYRPPWPQAVLRLHACLPPGRCGTLMYLVAYCSTTDTSQSCCSCMHTKLCSAGG